MKEMRLPPEGFSKIPERQPVLSTVLGEHDLLSAQRVKRKELLESLEKRSPKGTKTAYISFFC
jgi:hypothetical protein